MNLLKSENLSTLAKALVKAQKEMGSAMKDSKNPYFKSNYADLNAVIDASVPVLNANGIAVLQTPGLGTDGISVINTILLHESGEFLAGQSKVVAAKVNDPQSEGSATTYARRYGLQAMVTLKAEDDDGEKAMGRTSFTKPTETKKAIQTEDTKKVTPAPEKEAVKEVQETKTEAAPKKSWSSARKKQIQGSEGDY